MIKVIKKDGKTEEFNLNKLKKSLIFTIERTNLSQEDKNMVVEKITKEVVGFLKNKKVVFSSEIEAKIILSFEEHCPQALQIWREYRLKKEKEEVK